MYWWHPYPRMLDQMFHLHAMPKVLSTLQVESMTLRELARTLKLTPCLVKFTIGQLRRMGHTIENRDSWCGKPPRRGTYHLIEEAV